MLVSKKSNLVVRANLYFSKWFTIFFQPPLSLILMKTLFSCHSLTYTFPLLFPLSGGHGVSFAPSGDDNHRAHRRPVGRLPENTQPDVHHQRQEAHELWRWVCQTVKGDILRKVRMDKQKRGKKSSIQFILNNALKPPECAKEFPTFMTENLWKNNTYYLSR